jgi:tetratricopeptide (TPR) repeat protein
MSLEALAKAPDNPSILDTVGVLRYRQGRLRDGADGMGAITLFRQALRIRPEDPSLETLDHLGDALWQDGDQQAAIRCWQQVGQVAQLRYPPQEIAKNLVEFQRREFGLALLEPAPLLRRLYGRIADRAARKLEEVARGEPPSVRPMTLEASDGIETGTNR